MPWRSMALVVVPLVLSGVFVWTGVELPWNVGTVNEVVWEDPPQHPHGHTCELVESAEDYGVPDLKTLKALATHHDLPFEVNRSVVAWLRYYTGPGRADMQQYLERSGRYAPVMYEILDTHFLPRDLVYVAVAESGLSPWARSPKGAAGPWQFMRATASEYDLRRTRWVDLRRDPEYSTSAAARHLADLHESFDDWELALAAYNAGQGRVRGAIRRGKSRNYWRIRRYLPEETRQYVPRVLALAMIGLHPEAFGFDAIEYAEPYDYEITEIPGGTRLDELARKAGVSKKTLIRLNPALRRQTTPPGGSWPLRVPAGSTELLGG